MTQIKLADATDTQLLDRFNKNRDQNAFAEIVYRYGPMVMATARRVLQRPEDVEDSFQATMFALAKSAGQLRNKVAVAGWLHKTAYRCAVEIHRTNVRWNRTAGDMTERQSTAMNTIDETHPSLRVANAEMMRILDEELAGLSEPLRDVIVLYELQGMTQKAVAKRLGVSTSTINDRVARGRRLLRSRLVRRGATLTLAGVTCGVGTSDAVASIPKSVVTEVTAKATLFATGKSAAELGASASVVQIANKVVSPMSNAKLITLLLIGIAIVPFATLLSGSLGVPQRPVIGAEIFFDDFEDGDLTNNQPRHGNIPVIWQPFGASTTLEASSGKLVTSGLDFGLASTADVVNGRARLMLDDMSIRTQARLVEGEAVIVNPLRDFEGPRPGYLGVVGDGFARIHYGATLEVIGSTDTQFNISEEALMIQLDAIDNELQLWIWRPGEAMPDAPILSVIDDAIPITGMGDVAVGVLGEQARAEFAFVQVATESIPEPSSAALLALAVGGLIVARRSKRIHRKT